jgi:hypothetical protein
MTRVEVEGGINLKGWLILVFSSITELLFMSTRPNEIVFMFGTIFISSMVFCVILGAGITSKHIYEVPDSVDFLVGYGVRKVDEKTK